MDQVVVRKLGSLSLNITQVTIPTTAGGTTLIAARNGRSRVIVKNHDTTNAIYLGGAADTVTATSGLTILAGESVALETQAGLKALSASGSIIVGVVEEF